MYLAQEKYEEAFADIKKALALEPKNVQLNALAQEVMQQQLARSKIVEDLSVPKNFRELLEKELGKFNGDGSSSMEITELVIVALERIVKISASSEDYRKVLIKENMVHICCDLLRQQAQKSRFVADKKRPFLLRGLLRLLAQLVDASSALAQLEPTFRVVSSKEIGTLLAWQSEEDLCRLLFDFMVSVVKKLASLERDNSEKKGFEPVYAEIVNSVGHALTALDSKANKTLFFKSILQVFPNCFLLDKFIIEQNVLKKLLVEAFDVGGNAMLVMLLVQLKSSLQSFPDVKMEDEAVKKLGMIIGSLFTELFSKNKKLTALNIVNCVMQVHVPLGKEIFSKSGFIHEIMDCLEFEPDYIQQVTLELLSNACADKDSRSLISNSVECMEYVEDVARGSAGGDKVNDVLKNIALIVETKIETTAKPDPLMQQAGQNPQPNHSSTEADKVRIADMYMRQIITETNNSTAIEGLALLCVNPGVKELIISSSEFLSKIFALTKSSQGTEMYGIALILDQLTSYKPKLTEEQKQIQKIREFAKEAMKEVNDPRNNDEAVEKRVQKLVSAGVLGALFNLCKNASGDEMKLHVSHVYLACAKQTHLRGKMLQGGAVRALLNLTKIEDLKRLEDFRGDPDEKYPKYVLLAAQSLAKIAITQDPHIAFTNTASQLVRPFLYMLETSNELYQFESLMALTNLASMRDHNGETITRQLSEKKNLSLIQGAIFSDNKKVQQAGVELMCNLVSVTPCAEVVSKSANWIKLLAALCDADEFGTRIAASGALAILVNAAPDSRKLVYELDISPRIITSLLKEEKWEIQWRVLEILRALLEDNKDFILKLVAEFPEFKKRISALSKSDNPNVQSSAVAVLLTFN